MFGKTTKALVLVQLVVLATLAPIVLAHGPNHLPGNQELEASSNNYGRSYPNHHQGALQRRQTFGQGGSIQARGGSLQISPVTIGNRFQAVKLPSESVQDEVVTLMKQRSRAFYVQHHDGIVTFYYKDGEKFVTTSVKGTDCEAVKTAIHDSGMETVVMPNTGVAGEDAEASRKAKSSFSWNRKLFRRYLDDFSVRKEPLPTIQENAPLGGSTEPNRLQRQLAMVHSKFTPALNPVRMGDRFLAVKLPQNSWDSAVMSRLKGQKKPFFVQGKEGAVDYYYTRDGQTFTKQNIPDLEKATVRDAIRAHGAPTVITPAFEYSNPAAARAASGGSWTSRLANKWFGWLSKGVKYLRGP